MDTWETDNYRDNLKNQETWVITSEIRLILIYIVKLLNTAYSQDLNDI